MKKILYFVQLPPPVHGVSTINKYIVDSCIINQGIEKHILEIKFSDKIPDLRKVTFTKLLKVVALIFKLISAIRTVRPDYIYFSIMPVGKGFARDLLFVLIIKCFKVKPIFHLHNQGICKAQKNIILKKIYQFVFENSIIIHLSEGLMKTEINFLNLKNAQTYILNNGVIETENLQKQKYHNGISLLYLSNLFPEKGLSILIESVKILNVKKYNVSLNIIGSMRKDKQVKKILADIKCNNIFFRGEIFNGEKYRYLSEADIFVHPTTNDSFPLVIIEAMQAGLPVISTHEGAIPELIENGVNGILVEKGSVTQLVEAIEFLINNSELRVTMGENGRKKYLEKYTKTMFEENLKVVFDEMVK